MTTWTITLSGDRGEFDVDADTVTTRDDGSLWLLAETEPQKPMRVVLILARGVWSSCYPSDTHPPPKPPPKPAREPRLIPAINPR